MSKLVKRILAGAAAVLLLCSVAGNIYLINNIYLISNNNIWNLNYPDANSRDTYDTIHNVSQAHKISTGEGIKVGILDWGFGFKQHEGLYAGGKDFATGDYHEENFNETSEHGFWMAQTLKEIAPGVSIYALGTYDPNSEDRWVDAMIEAIRWSMEEEIDILTLSHQMISDKNRQRFDDVVNEAIAQGIVTTFIHYDNPNNILPWGIWSDEGSGYNRASDVNIFPYDYNTVFIDGYKEIVGSAEFDQSYKAQLFTSVSSMSVVTAGFVAMLKEADDTLTPGEYKDILILTSRQLKYDKESADHVADIQKALEYLLQNK